jgi:hypothetical protein
MSKPTHSITFAENRSRAQELGVEVGFEVVSDGHALCFPTLQCAPVEGYSEDAKLMKISHCFNTSTTWDQYSEILLSPSNTNSDSLSLLLDQPLSTPPSLVNNETSIHSKLIEELWRRAFLKALSAKLGR